LAVGSQPAFAAITDDLGADDEVLNHEVFVTFEDRIGWRVDQRDDDLVGDGQEGGLEPLGGPGPLLTRGAWRAWRNFQRTGCDQGSGFQTLQAGDFIAELLDDLLLPLEEVQQLSHQRGRFGFGNLGQR
jgi:hypothetical protein